MKLTIEEKRQCWVEAKKKSIWDGEFLRAMFIGGAPDFEDYWWPLFKTWIIETDKDWSCEFPEET